MVRANFTDGNNYTEAPGLTQWDYGQVLEIHGLDLPKAVEIHFAIYDCPDDAIIRIGNTVDKITSAAIPEKIMEQSQDAVAYVYVSDTQSGETVRTVYMPMTARQKPEAFDAPEDAEIFKETIEMVNAAADRAELAKSDAETARDVAQSTADETEADRAEVEALKSQAQTAAESALLSEHNAKASETAAQTAQAGAETAEGQAELFAGQAEENKNFVEAAKAVVMELGQKVADDKSNVEQAVSDFEIARQNAVREIKAAENAALENIGTGIDDTLTQSGKAADAKETGDKLSKLKGDLSNVKDVVLKENSPLFGWEIGSINTAGANIDSTNTIRTESGVYYTFPAGTEISVLDDSVQFVVAMYKSSTASRTAWASTPVVVPDNCRIRIAMRKTNQSALDDTSISVKLVYQKQYDSTIEEVKYDFAKSNAIIIDEGINLLNLDDADIVENYYINRTGFELPQSGLFISGYIKCNKGDVFCFNKSGTFLDECVYVYDSHKEWISNQIATDVSNIIRQVTIQYANAAYIRFAVNTTNHDTAMIVRGDTYPDEYIPYKNEERKLMDDVYLGTQAKNDVVAIVASMCTNNPLVGKKIAATGDSICFGAGNDGVGYVGIIAERNNMTYQNLAVSGATITDTTSIQSSNVCITNTISNLDSNADYIILEGGVNDASYDVELGTPNPLCVFDETPTTFYGWLDKMFGSVRIKFPTKKIGFIIVHQTQKKFSAFHNGAYYNAIVEMCDKWGIPYCDLNKTCPPFTMFSAEGNAELYAIRQAYTKNGDGWHPNDDGYRLFYVPQIESWLKTL